MERFYTAIIERAPNGYGVFFPDLPGCTSFGNTVADAAANACLAAQAHAALSAQYGEELPLPRSPAEIGNDPDVKEAVRLLVPVETSGEPVRVNISLPATALAALDRTAKELSLTRSGAIAHLALTRGAHARSVKPRGTRIRRKKKASTR